MKASLRRVALGLHEIVVADDQPTFWDRVEAGRWEPGTLAALTPLLGSRTTFLDLGAWVGPLSLLAAAQGARVIAVEADPAALDQLHRNLAANPGLAARIEVVEAAVSPEPGTVRLGMRRKRGDSMSSIMLADGPGAWSAPATTPAMLAERVRGAARLVVKIDIEGAEYALMPHLAPLLASPQVAVLVSFHPAILTQSGESDVAAATAAALEPFAGWSAFAIGADGASGRGTLRPSRFSTTETDTWLFQPP